MKSDYVVMTVNISCTQFYNYVKLLSIKGFKSCKICRLLIYFRSLQYVYKKVGTLCRRKTCFSFLLDICFQLLGSLTSHFSYFLLHNVPNLFYGRELLTAQLNTWTLLLHSIRAEWGLTTYLADTSLKKCCLNGNICCFKTCISCSVLMVHPLKRRP